MFKTIRIMLNVDKKDIIYLNSIIDSYDGIAIMRTIDKKLGNVVIFTTENFENLVIHLLNSLKQEGILLEIIGKEKNELIDKWN
jgi:hypothetical protein